MKNPPAQRGPTAVLGTQQEEGEVDADEIRTGRDPLQGVNLRCQVGLEEPQIPVTEVLSEGIGSDLAGGRNAKLDSIDEITGKGYKQRHMPVVNGRTGQTRQRN